MSSKIDGELLKRLERAERIEPLQEIPVVVTLKSSAAITSLEQKGLKVQNVYENISAVSGVVKAAQVKDLTQLDEVEKVEYDGQDWALKAPPKTA